MPRDIEIKLEPAHAEETRLGCSRAGISDKLKEVMYEDALAIKRALLGAVIS